MLAELAAAFAPGQQGPLGLSPVLWYVMDFARFQKFQQDSANFLDCVLATLKAEAVLGNRDLTLEWAVLDGGEYDENLQLLRADIESGDEILSTFCIGQLQVRGFLECDHDVSQIFRHITWKLDLMDGVVLDLLDILRYNLEYRSMGESKDANCDACNKKSRAVTWNRPIQFGSVLIIELKRFVQIHGKNKKRMSTVLTPEFLTVVGIEYELRCIVVHQGNALERGHYVALVAHGETVEGRKKTWYEANDTMFRVCRGGVDPFHISSSYGQACVLFYRRVAEHGSDPKLVEHADAACTVEREHLQADRARESRGGGGGGGGGSGGSW